MSAEIGDAARALRRVTHRTIAAVSEALENFAFNVAVARLYELTNTIADAERADQDASLGWARREALEMLARLVAPMMPHLAEQAYVQLHPKGAQLVAELPWPEPEPDLLSADSVTIAVQVMGKLRGTIVRPPNSGEAANTAAALQEPNVVRALEGKQIRKTIYVPDRIINFVAG
jgi:leucyl-tRNA synthetase